MRQFWTRACRSRLFLVLAATSVITLAASSPIYSAVSEWHVAGHDSASAVAVTGGTSTGAAECSRAAALEVATRLHLVPDPTLPNPVAGVLCGAFAGVGSQAMVATFARATCLPNFGWAAFSFTGGAWQLVANGSHPGFVIALVAVGSDLRETVPIWRKTDLLCFPTGGTKARSWHWDGSGLVAGPWKQITKGEPESRAFHSPSGGIECGLGDSPSYRGVGCHSHTERRPLKFNAVTMDASGRLKICRGSFAHCKLGQVGDVPTLGYGRQITVGRFRCLSLRSGVRCTVIQSGKGFLINRSGVRRVGP